jgi:hypothetical protein
MWIFFKKTFENSFHIGWIYAVNKFLNNLLSIVPNKFTVTYKFISDKVVIVIEGVDKFTDS